MAWCGRLPCEGTESFIFCFVSSVPIHSELGCIARQWLRLGSRLKPSISYLAGRLAAAQTYSNHYAQTEVRCASMAFSLDLTGSQRIHSLTAQAIRLHPLVNPPNPWRQAIAILGRLVCLMPPFDIVASWAWFLGSLACSAAPRTGAVTASSTCQV